MSLYRDFLAAVVEHLIRRAERRKGRRKRDKWKEREDCYLSGCNSCLCLSPARLHRLLYRARKAAGADEHESVQGPNLPKALGYLAGVHDVCEYITVFILAHPSCGYEPIVEPRGVVMFHAGILYEKVRQRRGKVFPPAPCNN